MESQRIKFIVEGLVFEVWKDSMVLELEEAQRKTLQDKITLPAWVSVPIFELFQKYLASKTLEIYKHNCDDTFLIQTLRLTDYLGMYRFQQKFISQVITPSISIANCVIFLEETHRKLKNQDNGSQCWYSLLNASITFLALNIREVYKQSSDKLKKLHQKILNQILDRSIRNGNVDQQMIFELIMESRRVSSVDSLCELLRNTIENKKINPKIHAKLSWKLQDVANIKDKRTKHFKFLDLDWLLEATRNNKDELVVKLTFCGIEGRYEIGAFYVKLMWWMDGRSEDKREEKIKINYLLMNRREEIEILSLSPGMQRELGKSKIELSIFGCLDQIYTFSLNYLARNHEKVEVQERKLTAQQLSIIVLHLKQKKQYSSSIRFLKFLAFVKGEIPQEYLKDYPFSQLTPYQIDFIQKMSTQKIVPVDLSPNFTEGSQIRSSVNQSRKSQQRPQSRGRLRKIFASSPSRSVNLDTNGVKLQDISRIANLKNYFYDKTSPLYSQL